MTASPAQHCESLCGSPYSGFGSRGSQGTLRGSATGNLTATVEWEVLPASTCIKAANSHLQCQVAVQPGALLVFRSGWRSLPSTQQGQLYVVQVLECRVLPARRLIRSRPGS